MLEFVGFLCLTGGVAARALHGSKWRWRALTAWCAACSFFVFYPPVWAPMLWVVCALVIDVGRRRQQLGPSVLLVAAIGFGATIGLFYHLPYLSLVVDSLYPGNRIAFAGTLHPARLIEMVWPSLTAAAPVHCGPERYLGLEASNVCEASSLEVLPLALLLALALVSARVRRALVRLFRSSPASLLAFAILSAWLFAPLPAWFGWMTLLRWSPTPRAFIGFGISAALLASHLLATLRADPEVEPLRWRALVALPVVAACAFAAKEHIRPELVQGCYARAWLPPLVMTAILLLAGAISAGTRRGANILLAAWVGGVVLANHRVNPIIHSRQMFSKGQGHDTVDRALAQTPGRLLDYSTHPGAQLAAFGWPTLGGVHNAPAVALFQFLASESPGLSEEIYNRYAHSAFVMPPQRTELLAPDHIRVAIDPCGRTLRALGVNHLLTEVDSGPTPACASAWISQPVGQLRLWSRRQPVCAVGVGRGGPRSALDFDYACPTEAKLARHTSGFTLEVPADAARSWALAVNPATIAHLDCVGASGRIVAAHLVLQPQGDVAASCRARYVDSPAALRRLWKRW
jgi:hypothetical protein